MARDVIIHQINDWSVLNSRDEVWSKVDLSTPELNFGIHKFQGRLWSSGYTPEEWLDGFNTFSIYQVLPQLIELWGLNVQTDVSAKKTSSNRSPDDNTFIFASLCTAGD